MTLIHNGLSGALAAQIALDTTSRNIANLMTPGYTRQGVLLAAVQPQYATARSTGGGVTVASLLRFNDDYKNMQMWLAASELGQRSSIQPYLTQLEQVMGDDGSNLNGGLDAFFAALNAASVEPGSIPLRQQVITAADALAQRFNSLGQVLANQRLAVQQQRSSVVSQVNVLANGIAVLNSRITAATAAGSNPSELIDARDGKIDELAGLIGVQVVNQADGSRNVALRNGQPLVVGASAATMKVIGNADGSQTLKLDFAHEEFTLLSTSLGGQIGGLDDFEQQILVPLTQSVRDMAQALSDGINGILASGHDLDGDAGIALFDFDGTSTTAMLGINSALLAGDLAFSADPAAPGNSGRLLELIAFKDQAIMVGSLGSVLLGDATTQLIGRLGTQSQQNQTALATARTVRNQAEESWKATSGVNQDEEAIGLMQYMQMYQANMKVVAVANELFDHTLAMMR